MLVFVIPLAHPQSVRRWEAVVARLKETAASVASACAGTDAKAILVVNHEAKLPPLPDCIEVTRVDLNPPKISVFKGESPESERLQAKELDKGVKVLIGAIEAKKQGASYVMPVDADDLISVKLSGFVSRNRGQSGWFVQRGWVKSHGSNFLFLRDNFHSLCGTCFIVKTELLELPDFPEDLEQARIRQWFGSHKHLLNDFEKRKTPLEALPFPGAIYQMGHGENNYSAMSVRKKFLPKWMLKSDPIDYFKQLTRFKYLRGALKKEFYG